MTINDKNWDFLHDATGLSLTYNDMYYRYLRDQGYTGTLQDMIGKSKRGINAAPNSGNPSYAGGGVQYGIAGNRSGLLVTQASVQQVASKIVHRNGNVAIRNPRLRFVNWLVDASGVVVPNSFDLTVTASLQIGTDSRIQATFGGATSAVIEGTAPYEDSDAFGGVTIPANSDFTVRTWADAGTGGTYQFGIVAKSGFDAYGQGASVADTTMAGDPSGGFFRTYSAALVWGECDRGEVGFIVFGDSLTYGGAAAVGELSTTGGDAYGSRGYPGRLLRSEGYNYMNFGRASVRASQWAAAGAMDALFALVEPVMRNSKVIVALGRNDIDASRTPAEIIADLGSMNGAIEAKSPLQIINGTVLPKSSSTDSWATVENQTPETNSADTNTVNGAIRANSIAGQEAAFDGSTAASTAEDSSIWKVDGGAWTTDGTHQTTVGAAGTAAALTLPA